MCKKLTNSWGNQEHTACLFVYMLLTVVAWEKKEILSDQLLQQQLWI